MAWRDGRYPVLHEAAALARRLCVPLTFTHNVEPIVARSASSSLNVPVVLAPSRAMLSQRRSQLRSIGDALGHDGDVLVLSEPDTARALLDIASERDADMLVVGARQRGWLARAFSAEARVLVRHRGLAAAAAAAGE